MVLLPKDMKLEFPRSLKTRLRLFSVIYPQCYLKVWLYLYQHSCVWETQL